MSDTPEPEAKRGRGRPKGSKTKQVYRRPIIPVPVPTEKFNRTRKNYVITKTILAEKLMHMASISLTDVISWGANGVTIIDSKELTEEVAYGVMEVEEKAIKRNGKPLLRIKIVDRRAAIVDLAKLLGMMTEEDKPPPAENEAKRQQNRETLIKVCAQTPRFSHGVKRT